MEPVVLRGEMPDPTRIPEGCRFHPRCPAARRRLRCGRRGRRGLPSTPLAIVPDVHAATTWPATWSGRERVSRLQSALPREMYVDDAAGRASASGCCSRRGRASAGSTTWGSSEPGQPGGRRRRGGVGAAHPRRGGSPRGVQRVPAPRLADRADRARRRDGLLGGRRPAVPLPLLDLLAVRAAAARAAHRRCRGRPGRLLAPPGGGRGVGGVRLRAPDARRGRAASPTVSPRRRPTSATTRWPTSSPALTLHLRRRAPTGRSSPRTTTSATTAARCTPSCRGWCPPSAAGAPTWRGTTASRTGRARGPSR